MAEKKNKKAPAKETKKAPVSSSSGKNGCLFFVIVSFLFCLCLLAGGFLLLTSPAGSESLSRILDQLGVLPSPAGTPGPAGQNFSSLPESMPADEALGRKLIEEAEANFRQQAYEKARNDARIALEKFPFSSPYWHRASDLITRSSFAILHSPGDNALEKKRVLTGRGDTLKSLGDRFGLTPETIRQADPKLEKISSVNAPIGEGMTLFLYCGKWNLKISNARKRLFVMDGEKLFAVYPVGIADDFEKAKTGCRSSITAKIAKPAWKLGNDLYSPGHPMNILGGYSMEFRDGTGKNLFRIHGTNREENVGRTIHGPGCVSMKNEHIKELFHLIPTGTRVEVIR